MDLVFRRSLVASLGLLAMLVFPLSPGWADFQVNVTATVNYPTHAVPPDQGKVSTGDFPGNVTGKTSAKNSAAVIVDDDVVAAAKGRAFVDSNGKVHLGVQATTERSPQNYATATGVVAWRDRLYLDFGSADATSVRFEMQMEGSLSGTSALVNLGEVSHGLGFVTIFMKNHAALNWGEVGIVNEQGLATGLPAVNRSEEFVGGVGPRSFSTPVYFDVPIQVDEQTGRSFVHFNFALQGYAANFDQWGNEFEGGKVDFYNSAILEAITLPEFGGATPESLGYKLSFESGLASPNQGSIMRTPEPTALFLLAIGGGGLLTRRWLRSRKAMPGVSP